MPVTEARREGKNGMERRGCRVEKSIPGNGRVYSASASRRIVVAISRSSTPTSYFPACVCAPAREEKQREGSKKDNKME